MRISPYIFREYDIRGKVGEDFTEEVVREIGRAYGTLVKSQGGKKIVCGRDGRLSSPLLQNALIEGILDTGINVINIGMVPTPVMYFSLFYLKDVDGGIEVTGSHNPPEFNGLKICLGKETLYGKHIQKIREIIEKKEYSIVKEKGKVEDYPHIIEDYVSYIKKNVEIKKKLKVVIDPGNGVTALTAPKLFKTLGCDVECLFCEVDGNFPNHFPDPVVPDNLKDLIKKVKEIKADVGFGYDGDGDRIGVVDDEGNIIWGDQLLLLFALEILKKQKGVKIIAEVKCSRILFEEIKKAGGVPIMWKTGHSLIKKKMKDENAILAGEMSGHLFFADKWFGFDDAVYASLRLAEIISSWDKPLSEWVKSLPKLFSTPEIRKECPDEIKFEVVNRLKEKFKKEGLKIIDIDGVRIEFEEGWALVRASNTQPVLVFRFEAKAKEFLEYLQEKVFSAFEEEMKKV